jgi:aminoglycoside phosphotransferase (APT) family kinase protein
MEIIKYSDRLGALSGRQFQAALDRFDLGQLVGTEPISAGSFGQNVFLSSTKGEYVFRGAPFYASQFPGERFFTQKLHESTQAPVPWPYLLDPSDTIFGWSYVIMPRMPGLQLGDSKVYGELGAEDRRGIARAMGETLAEMHKLTWTCAGEYDLEADTILPFDIDYGERVISLSRCCLQEGVSLSDRTTDADVLWTEEVISRNQEALEILFEPCFVDGDYKPANVVVECIDGVWRVSGVFDYMNAHFGDGELDLVRLVAVYLEQDPELAHDFVQAYVHHRPPRPGFVERFRFYMLFDRLICWQFGQRHGVWWEPGLTLREWVEPYIETGVSVLWGNEGV